MDSWYAVADMMKYVTGKQKVFYCPLKTNRKADDSQGQQAYRQRKYLQWSKEELAKGKQIELHKMPQDTYFKLFRVVLSVERIDYIATNNLTQQDTEAAKDKKRHPWDG